MRRQLIALLGTEQQADEALNLLLAHLVSAGFGDYKKGRLRDFLVRGLRSAAKSRLSEMPKDETPGVDLEQLTIESKEWLRLWREGLLERAWRSLERKEHAEPELPVYSVLHQATANPEATPEMLAVQINTEFGLQIDQQIVRSVTGGSRLVCTVGRGRGRGNPGSADHRRGETRDRATRIGQSIYGPEYLDRISATTE